MTTAATKGFGTLLKRNGTTIAEVRDINGPGLQRDTIDVTNHSSPGGWREFIAGLKSGGEVTFEIGFSPQAATHSYSAGLVKDFDEGTLQSFDIIFTDSGTTAYTFSAFVTNFTPNAPVEGDFTANVTLKISGPVTFE